MNFSRFSAVFRHLQSRRSEKIRSRCAFFRQFPSFHTVWVTSRHPARRHPLRPLRQGHPHRPDRWAARRSRRRTRTSASSGSAFIGTRDPQAIICAGSASCARCGAATDTRTGRRASGETFVNMISLGAAAFVAVVSGAVGPVEAQQAPSPSHQPLRHEPVANEPRYDGTGNDGFGIQQHAAATFRYDVWGSGPV